MSRSVDESYENILFDLLDSFSTLDSTGFSSAFLSVGEICDQLDQGKVQGRKTIKQFLEQNFCTQYTYGRLEPGRAVYAGYHTAATFSGYFNQPYGRETKNVEGIVLLELSHIGTLKIKKCHFFTDTPTAQMVKTVFALRQARMTFDEQLFISCFDDNATKYYHYSEPQYSGKASLAKWFANTYSDSFTNVRLAYQSVFALGHSVAYKFRGVFEKEDGTLIKMEGIDIIEFDQYNHEQILSIRTLKRTPRVLVTPLEREMENYPAYQMGEYTQEFYDEEYAKRQDEDNPFQSWDLKKKASEIQAKDGSASTRRYGSTLSKLNLNLDSDPMSPRSRAMSTAERLSARGSQRDKSPERNLPFHVAMAGRNRNEDQDEIEISSRLKHLQVDHYERSTPGLDQFGRRMVDPEEEEEKRIKEEYGFSSRGAALPFLKRKKEIDQETKFMTREEKQDAKETRMLERMEKRHNEMFGVPEDELAQASVKVQKAFRKHRARKGGPSRPSSSLSKKSSSASPYGRRSTPSSSSRHSEFENSRYDRDQELAAQKIQASYRKRIKKRGGLSKREQREAELEDYLNAKYEREHEEAAKKIQASYRKKFGGVGKKKKSSSSRSKKDPYGKYGNKKDPYDKYGKKSDQYDRYSRKSNREREEEEDWRNMQYGREHDEAAARIQKSFRKKHAKKSGSGYGKKDPYDKYGKKDPYDRYGKKSDPYDRSSRYNNRQREEEEEDWRNMQYGREHDEAAARIQQTFRKKKAKKSGYGASKNPYDRYGSKQDTSSRYGSKNTSNRPSSRYGSRLTQEQSEEDAAAAKIQRRYRARLNNRNSQPSSRSNDSQSRYGRSSPRTNDSRYGNQSPRNTESLYGRSPRNNDSRYGKSSPRNESPYGRSSGSTSKSSFADRQRQIAAGTRRR